MNALKVGIIGFGVVGSGTVEALQKNRDEITRRSGREIVIAQIASRKHKELKNLGFCDKQITSDWHDVVNNPEVDVVVELFGGDTTAKEIILASIAAGKHVVTANKALLAKYGNQIFAKAGEQKLMIGYEAAVAGGIPIIKALRETLTGNRILEIKGIINGTSNFILSAMYEQRREFSDALAEAQKLGYAEADPTFDIEGNDAQHKLAIMGGIAFGIPIQLDKVYCEGISKLSKVDIQYADKLGYRVKLLAIARRKSERLESSNGHNIELRVHPTLIPKKEILANVEGVMNAVEVVGDRVGTLLFYGAGAGANPTGSAVVADLVDIARDGSVVHEDRVPYLAFLDNQLSKEPLLSIDEIESSYYLRIKVINVVGALAQITAILADGEISIDSILQYELKSEGEQVDMVFLLHKTREGVLKKAIVEIEKLSVVSSKAIIIRK